MKISRLILLSIFLLLGTLLPSLRAQIPCIHDLTMEDSVYYLNSKIFEGPFECLDKKGNLREKGNIEMGMLDSVQFFNKRGDLNRINWYEQKQISRYRVYNKNLSTLLVINFKGENMHGSWEEFYGNGQLKERHHYHEGDPAGKWYNWDKQGRLTYEINFDLKPVVGKYYSYKGEGRLMRLRIFDDEFGMQKTESRIVGEPLPETQ